MCSQIRMQCSDILPLHTSIIILGIGGFCQNRLKEWQIQKVHNALSHNLHISKFSISNKKLKRGEWHFMQIRLHILPAVRVILEYTNPILTWVHRRKKYGVSFLKLETLFSFLFELSTEQFKKQNSL